MSPTWSEICITADEEFDHFGASKRHERLMKLTDEPINAPQHWLPNCLHGPRSADRIKYHQNHTKVISHNFLWPQILLDQAMNVVIILFRYDRKLQSTHYSVKRSCWWLISNHTIFDQFMCVIVYHSSDQYGGLGNVCYEMNWTLWPYSILYSQMVVLLADLYLFGPWTKCVRVRSVVSQGAVDCLCLVIELMISLFGFVIKTPLVTTIRNKICNRLRIWSGSHKIVQNPFQLISESVRYSSLDGRDEGNLEIFTTFHMTNMHIVHIDKIDKFC